MIFKFQIDKTLNALLLQEDTDGDKKITKEDKGPKKFKIMANNGVKYTVEGTYHLSNLLQELAFAKNEGLSEVEISISKIEEAPTHRISRMIREVFWDNLTRTIDEEGILKIVGDDKTNSSGHRIYVPFSDKNGQAYYNKIAAKYAIEVTALPENITPEFVKSINNKPGILSLELENEKGTPFVVPGGRFNEMYGWDSYFEGVGLLLDGRIDLAKAMVDNFCYQIIYYGKILNANRSYYLTRTQPPFLSSFIREVYETNQTIDEIWLKNVLEIAIIEYETVWMVDKKRLTANGLNRYFAEGIGIPPETEPGHFNEVLEIFAKKYNLSIDDFVEKYQKDIIKDQDLDLYFIHDRSLRESGHDTSWRLHNVCADLNTVDLNSLLYKYETDFAHLIETYFAGEFKTKTKIYTTEYWLKQADNRKVLMNTFLWSDENESYFDYNFEQKSLAKFTSATNFYPLWSKCCSQEQAHKMVPILMKDLIVKGGIAGTSKKSVEEISKGKVERQWDYPYG